MEKLYFNKDYITFIEDTTECLKIYVLGFENPFLLENIEEIKSFRFQYNMNYHTIIIKK